MARTRADTYIERALIVLFFFGVPLAWLSYGHYLLQHQQQRFISGAARAYRVDLDDGRFFELKPNRFVDVALAAGEHDLHITTPDGRRLVKHVDTRRWALFAPFSDCITVNPDEAATLFGIHVENDKIVWRPTLQKQGVFCGDEVHELTASESTDWLMGLEEFAEPARVAHLKARLAFDPGDSAAAAELAGPPPPPHEPRGE